MRKNVEIHFWKKITLGISIFLILTSWPVMGLAEKKDSKLERRIQALERMVGTTLEWQNNFPMRVYPINSDVEMYTWYLSVILARPQLFR